MPRFPAHAGLHAVKKTNIFARVITDSDHSLVFCEFSHFSIYFHELLIHAASHKEKYFQYKFSAESALLQLIIMKWSPPSGEGIGLYMPSFAFMNKISSGCRSLFNSCGYYRGGMILGYYHSGMIPGYYHGGMILGYYHGGMILGYYHGGMILGYYHGGMILGYYHGGMILGCYHGGMILGYYHGGMILGYYHDGMILGYYHGGMILGYYHVE